MKRLALLGSTIFLSMILLTGCGTEKKNKDERRTLERVGMPYIALDGDQVVLDSKELKAYLKEEYGISLNKNFTKEDFMKATEKIQSRDNIGKLKSLRLEDVLGYNLNASGFEELTNTYTKEQVKNTLDENNIYDKIKKKSEVATSLDINMLYPSQVSKINEKIDVDTANYLLYYGGFVNGRAQNFIGYSDDPSIYAEVDNIYKEGKGINDKKLFDLGTELVKAKASTGFNIKKDEYSPKFLDELTLTYGHSSIDHSKQLLALLEKEGIVARVQVEPKESVFEYLLEWGDVPEPTDIYWVEKISDDFYLAHSYEYDLSLEFENKKDKEDFDKIVKKYAKKDSENSKEKGLIVDSWWQPLYISHNNLDGNYKLIYDNVVKNKNFSIHPFSLPENKGKLVDKIKEIEPEYKVDSKKIYCNDAFYRYLEGESE